MNVPSPNHTPKSLSYLPFPRPATLRPSSSYYSCLTLSSTFTFYAYSISSSTFSLSLDLLSPWHYTSSSIPMDCTSLPSHLFFIICSSNPTFICLTYLTVVNLKLYCTHFLYCPVQLGCRNCTALFRTLCRVFL